MKRIGLGGLLPLAILALVVAACSESSTPSSNPASGPGSVRKQATRKQASRSQSRTARPTPENKAGPGSSGSDSIVDILPEDTVFVVHCPDLGRTRSALEDTTLADIFREKEFARLLSVPLDTLNRALNRIREDRGVDLAGMLNDLKGEAVLGVTLDRSEPGVILGLDLGNAFLAAHRLLLKLGKGRFTLKKLHDVDVFSLRLSPRSGDDLHVCFHQGRLLAASKPALLSSALKGSSSPFGANELYRQATTETLGSGADLRVFLDLRPLIQMATLTGGDDVRCALRALGVDQLAAVAMATAVDSPLFRERLVVLGQGPLPLFDRLLVNHPVNCEMLNRVPRSVESFMAGRFRLNEVPASLSRLLTSADKSATASLTAGIRQAENQLGMPLAGFLAAIGDEMVYMKLPTPSAASLDDLLRNPLAGAVLVVRLQDPARVQTALDRMSQVPGGLQRDPFGGQPGYRWPIHASIPLEPRLVLKDGWLMAAADEDTLDRYVARPRGSVMDSPTFQIRLRGMPDEVAAVSFTDLRPTVRHVMEIAQGMMPLLSQALDGQAGLPSEWQRLPDPEAINRHLTPVTSYVQVIPNGVAMESVSPIGTLALLVPAIVVGLAPSLVDAVSPTTATAPDRGRRSGPAWLRLLGDGRPTTRGGGGAAPQRPSRWARASRTRQTLSTPQQDEKAILHLMRSLVDAQAMFKKACAVDTNANRVGEYATFAELAGAVSLRETERVLTPPILTDTFGRIQKGQLRRSGYFLRLFLPDRDGKPLGERAQGGAPTTVDAGRAEQAWCVLAWPLAPRKGARSFYVDQTGQVWQSDFPYHGDKAPDPVALLKTAPAGQAGFQLEEQGKDGSRWTLAK